MAYNTYPLKERTYFDTEQAAWAFAQAVVKLPHYIVTDYGKEVGKDSEPFYIETLTDPWMPKDALLKHAGMRA